MEQLEILNKYQVDIQNKTGNTSFIDNLKSIDLKEYFIENEGVNKINFAKKYIEILKDKKDEEQYTPSWIIDIKNFITK